MERIRPEYYELVWRDAPDNLVALREMLGAWDLEVREDQAGDVVARYRVPVYASPGGGPVDRTFTRDEIVAAARELDLDPESATARVIWRRFLRDVEPPDATPAPSSRR